MDHIRRKDWIPFGVAFLAVLSLLLFHGRANAQSDLFRRLVETSKWEVEKKGGRLSVGLEWTKRESRAVFKLFQKDFPFVKDFSIERVRGIGQYQSMLLELKQGKNPDFDVLKISMDVRSQFEEQGLSVKPPFDYQELGKGLPAEWGELDPRVIDPRGYFLSTASYTHGIAYNKGLVPADKAPKGWEDCLDPQWKGKVLYDPRAKLHAFYYDPQFREWHLKWIKDLLKNEAVLNRGQTENLQKVAAGEFPLTCGIQYNSTARLMKQGAPLEYVLGDPISTRLATEFHVVKWSKTPATTQLLALWLATKGQEEIDKQGGRGFPWARGTRLYPMARGKTIAVCDADCSAKIADEYDRVHADLLNLPGVR